MTRRLLLALVLTLACLSSAGGMIKTLTLTASADSACVLYLSDGSAWEIRGENRPKAASWPMKTQIGVYKVEDREFAYRLVLRPGKSNGDIVAARRLVRIK